MANKVALYMSAWIEIFPGTAEGVSLDVALYMSAWIEIFRVWIIQQLYCVALYMSAWIEMALYKHAQQHL